jgi:uncharacterized protein YecT (DUF1311 family)
MATLIDPAPAAGNTNQSLNARVLGADQLDPIRATVNAWLDSYGVEQLASLHAGMTLTRATLIPVAKVQLRTRYETRSVTSKSDVYQAGTHYERRTFKDSDFPVWAYLLGDSAGSLRAGVLPQSVTQKVPFSDVITDCAACAAVGSKRCDNCGGQGHRQCGSCRGELEIKCASCSGAGEKKCWICNGHGEKKCHSCISGTRHDGSRCTACHGRGFTRCNECSDGFKSCVTCARRGIIRCPSCDSRGRVRCGSCGGAGKVVCGPCKGSGKFVATLYLTASQSEKVADAWSLPEGYDDVVPEDVTAWFQRDVGTSAARELSAQRFDAAPCEPADSPLAKTANGLIADSKRNAQCQSAADRLDLSHMTSADRIVQHWYEEHYLPLMKVDYRFDGIDYVLWTVAPAVTLVDHEHGFARSGASVFASEGPVIDYLERQLDDAAVVLKSGNLAEAARLADALLEAVPGFKKAAALKTAILGGQSFFAALGSLLAAAGAALFYVARMQSSVPGPLSSAAIAALVVGAIAVVAPFALTRVVYKSRRVALIAQCALISAILLPVVASLKPGTVAVAAQRAPLATSAIPVAPKSASASARAPASAIAPPAATQRAPALEPDRADDAGPKREQRIVEPVVAATPRADEAPPPSVAAPGFDCGKASTMVEKMICADPRLSALDAKLAQSYKVSLASAADPQTLRSEQRAWLASVRNRCPDPECIAQAYGSRIASVVGGQ